MERRRGKGWPGPHLGVAVGSWYLRPVPSLHLWGFSSCFCAARPCSFFPMDSFLYSFFYASIHTSYICLPSYLLVHLFVCPSTCSLFFPSLSFPSPLPLLSVHSSSHLPICLSCLSISSESSTLPSVHRHSSNKNRLKSIHVKVYCSYTSSSVEGTSSSREGNLPSLSVSSLKHKY